MANSIGERWEIDSIVPTSILGPEGYRAFNARGEAIAEIDEREILLLGSPMRANYLIPKVLQDKVHQRRREQQLAEKEAELLERDDISHYAWI